MSVPRSVRLLLPYGAVLGVCAAGWIRVADRAVPMSLTSFPVDERLIVWVLAWVAHALQTDPRHLFDANIYYPAPGQLAGSETFAASQVVFAPLFWTTGNAVLAAGVTAMLSYPVAAVAMNTLLVRLGCGAAAAWVGGLVLALGPLAVPANLHVLQYPSLYLPLVALTLTRLRDRPTVWRSVGLGLVLLAACFNSYYMAVLAGVTAAAWGAMELLRPRARRGRFAALALGAAVVAFGALAAASTAYFGRMEAGGEAAPAAPSAYLAVAQAYLTGTGVLFGLAGPGLLAVPLRRGAGVAARRGLVLAVVAVLLCLGPEWRVGDAVIPLPFAVLEAAGGGFFRFPFRFVVVLGFALALLSAAAVEALAERRRRAGTLAAAVATAVVLAVRGTALVGDRLDEIGGPSLDLYSRIGGVADGFGRGPLLELPLIEPLGDPAARGTQADAMVGSTRHWLPLVGGFTGHPPPHWPLVVATVARLPATTALADLVDMTHVRWILLRPPAAWWRREDLEALGAMRGTTVLSVIKEHRLLSVDLRPRREEWFQAIARGPEPGVSLLGSPLAAIPAQLARSGVIAASRIPTTTVAGHWFGLDLLVSNYGPTPWPVAVPAGAGDAYTVHGLARWWRDGEPHDDAHAALTTRIVFPLDVGVSESIRLRDAVPTPPVPGAYALEISVRQVDGAAFDGPGNRGLERRIEVVPEGAPAAPLVGPPAPD